VSSPCWLLSAGSGLGGHCVGCPPPQVSRERSRRRIHRLGTRASEGRPRWIGSGAGTIAGRMASKGSGQDGPRRRCFLGHAGRQPHWAASFDWPSTPEEARIIVQGALTVTAALPRSPTPSGGWGRRPAPPHRPRPGRREHPGALVGQRADIRRFPAPHPPLVTVRRWRCPVATTSSAAAQAAAPGCWGRPARRRAMPGNLGSPSGLPQTTPGEARLVG
jgi:hypothetical protein